MPKVDYASKGLCLKGIMPQRDPFKLLCQKGTCLKKYALKGLCLKKLCPKGTMPPKTMPFYCTTGKALPDCGFQQFKE